MHVCGIDVKIEGKLIRTARPEADHYQSLEGPEKLIGELRRCGKRIDLFSFMQIMPETEPKYNYPKEWATLAVLPVSTFEHWWNQQIGFKARNKAKQAEKKGVVVREIPFNDALVEGICKIYNECPIRQGRHYPHYGKDSGTVYREEATFLDSSIFAGAFLNGALIGFTKLVHDKARAQAGLMNVLSMLQHRDKAPTNALIAQAVRSCAERGISHLVYSGFAYGKKQTSSLADFKERNGFERVNLPRYYVPLTLLGSLAYRLGLHHRLADRVPESLAAKLRELRLAWYSRKFKATTGTT